MGISLGLALLERDPNRKVLVIDKEEKPGVHASGRNSGVLHAGFYYSPDSLKAKFCRLGNLELRKFCKENNLQILETGKVVVCQDKKDVARLEELYRRGVANGVNIEILDSKDLGKIEPAAQTVDKFIWSPTTAVGNPKDVINKLAEKFTKSGGSFSFNAQVQLIEKDNEVLVKTKTGIYSAKSIINSAGAYAADLAKQVNVGTEYVCLPFLGAYKKSKLLSVNPKRLVYPVPNPVNPFLGVHTTITLNNEIKIGPTAFPVIGKEQYKLTDGFNLKELAEFFTSTTALVKSDSVDLIGLAKEEALKLFKKPLLNRTRKLSNSLDSNTNWVKYPSGIRAQIINTETKAIEMDYIVESDKNVVHILNAVSPGWTSAIPFAHWVVENQPLLA
ncbi:MAG: FAD-dependent oxidoreductase [Candidatus Nanopelagicales bacterium]|nr:FAD-dependent oxidoreductase [Candidatus Nanopelagicales bacterium]